MTTTTFDPTELLDGIERAAGPLSRLERERIGAYAARWINPAAAVPGTYTGIAERHGTKAARRAVDEHTALLQRWRGDWRALNYQMRVAGDAARAYVASEQRRRDVFESAHAAAVAELDGASA